jgi:8-amino-7-oxononanoate synthase
MSEGIIQADQPTTLEGQAPDLFAKFDPFIAMREKVLASGVEDPFNLVMEKVLSPTRAICNGRETILLGTYNYMGMTFDPEVIAAGEQALRDYGSGTTGSRVLNGTYAGHREVEKALCEFYAMDHAMVFSTGYQANLGIISTIAGKGRLHRPRHRQSREHLGRLQARRCRDRAVQAQRHRGDGETPQAYSRKRGQARHP